MRKMDSVEKKRKMEALSGRALLLAFGLGVLGFLVAIDRVDWFAIRPATGTSIAMASASDAENGAASQKGSMTNQ